MWVHLEQELLEILFLFSSFFLSSSAPRDGIFELALEHLRLGIIEREANLLSVAVESGDIVTPDCLKSLPR